ncbi:hypothetical protein HXX76_003607 [Chlamydomonas incerta]|uniref:Pherophorin domain-containing protein n=1 Tax=Chlamydomonas incerta TaxID=51695 RepID=A0A835TN26_CHLIN|nr:hypothetical protein HXX76_003607 [Chlamydomonas incerta]|eukprot:KAG2440750.1 hypothetical protein HXX76_003607 [Chlamydomonas incerta]
MLKASEENLPNGNYKVCFNFNDVGCATNNACCASLLQSVGKIEIQADKACKATIAGSTFGNVSKSGSTFFDDEFAVGKVRVTALNANRQMMDKSQLCLTIKPPCNSFDVFFQSGKVGGPGLYQYALFNSKADCCPTCVFAPSPPPPDVPAIRRPPPRWSVVFQGSEDRPQNIWYNFRIYLNAGANCRPVPYRNGTCCEASLEGISLPVMPDMKAAVVDATAKFGGDLLTATLFHSYEYGVRLQFKNPFYTDSISVGSYIAVSFAVAKASWTDASLFPCPASKWDPSGPTCDYWLHGYQTAPGNPQEPLIDPEVIPACCPEGVVHMCPPGTPGSCLAAPDASPYTLTFAGRARNGADTVFSFSLAHRNVRSACSAMAIDNMLLYVAKPFATAAVTATLGGVSTKVVAGAEGPTSYLNISMSSYASVAPGTVTVTVKGDVALSDLCVTPAAGGSRVCNYVLKGAQRTSGNTQACCPGGDIPATLPSGRRLLAVTEETQAAVAAGGSICAKADPSSACFALASVEISETFEEGTTYAFKLTRTGALASCPTEFQVQLSSSAMATFKEGHGHIWNGGLPAGDHFSWVLPEASGDGSLGTTTILSFTLKGRGMDRLSRVCTLGRNQDACVFRLVGSSGCYTGTVATDFQYAGNAHHH